MRCFSHLRLSYFLLVFALFFAFFSGFFAQSLFLSRNITPSTTDAPFTPSPSVPPSSILPAVNDLPSDHTVYSASPSAVLSSPRVLARVVSVIDGDTIKIEGGNLVRYIGVDTPEIVKTDSVAECFGKEASEFNASLVLGHVVELEKDVSETDRYGRLLRYVYVGSVFVNHTLVARGYAHAVTYPPDVKYQSLFIAAQRSAQESKLGLWGACFHTTRSPSSSPRQVLGTSTHSPIFSTPFFTPHPISSPSEGPQRDDGGMQNSVTEVRECVIKGNISSAGKIYHLPGCASYDKTTIH
jgi:micrococcal nuclease